MTSKQMHHVLELGLIVVLALVTDIWLILVHYRARSSLLCPCPCLYFLVCSARWSEEINPCFSGLQQLSICGSSPSNSRKMLLPSWVEEALEGSQWSPVKYFSLSVLEILDLPSLRSMSCLQEGLSGTSEEETWNGIRPLWKWLTEKAQIYLEHKHASYWESSTFPELTEVFFIL